MRKKILILLLMFCFSSKALANENPDFEKIYQGLPVYPNSESYDLEKILKFKMKVFLSNDSFEDVSRFYIKEMEKNGWLVEFPSPLELKLWFEALNHKKEEKNLILILTKNKPKINCNITISQVNEARLSDEITIITVYLTSKMLK